MARCGLTDAIVLRMAEFLCDPARCQALQVLMLDGNDQVADASVAALSRMLACNTTLQELSMWGTRISDAGVLNLAGGLRRNRSLKYLWMGECERITDKGALALKDALAANDTLEQMGLVCTQVRLPVQPEIQAPKSRTLNPTMCRKF